jgi:site-specific recombinase XerD
MARPLSDVEERYLDYHRALGHSPKTIHHYQDTFRLLHKWLDDTNRTSDTGSLTTASLEQFSTWLQTTPTNGYRGSTQRSAHGVFGVMKDLKAFVRFLLDEELPERNVKVKLPKLPSKLFPVLTKAELERVWATPQMTYRGAMGKRNRALVGLMLDTGIRRAADSAAPLVGRKLKAQGQRAIGLLPGLKAWAAMVRCNHRVPTSPSFMPSQVIGWHSRLTRATSF